MISQVLYNVVAATARQGLDQSVELAQIKSAKGYLKAVQQTRRLFNRFYLLLLMMLFSAGGLLLAFVGGLIWPLKEYHLLGQVFTVGGLSLFLITYPSFLFLNREKHWLHASGLHEWIRHLQAKKGLNHENNECRDSEVGGRG